jgi:hypothetical protein
MGGLFTCIWSRALLFQTFKQSNFEQKNKPTLRGLGMNILVGGFGRFAGGNLGFGFGLLDTGVSSTGTGLF